MRSKSFGRPALQSDEGLEVDEPDEEPEHGSLFRTGEQGLVRPFAGRLPEDVEVAREGDQRELRPQRIVSRSNWNGKPGGAPRRYEFSNDSASASFECCPACADT